MLYSDQIIEEVKRRVSLVELVSERVPVKQNGRNFQACCPFHTEKTPSFHINEDEGLYYCFGCGKKGNTFTFIMETKSLSFPESVRFLAQKVGVSLPVAEYSARENGTSIKHKNILRRVVTEVALIYEENLWNADSNIKSFLKDRRISDYTAKRFRMGYSDSNKGGQSLTDQVFSRIKATVDCSHKDVTESLISLGLLRKRQNGNLGELFWERIIFPITKSDLSPLAFGGRILKKLEGAPKYINSPESPVFEKRRSFFGLGQGFQPSQKSKVVNLVEGYLDVISFSQLGIDNTLAVCGTALTLDHVKILKRFVNKAILIFDGDGAGRAAAAKAFVPFLNSGIEVVPVILPSSEDPDTLTYDRTEDEVRSILKEKEVSLLKLYLEVLAGSLRGLERGVGIELSELNAAEAGKVSEKIASDLATIINPVELEFRIREACDYLGVTESSLSKLVKSNNKQNTSSHFSTNPDTGDVGLARAKGHDQSIQMPLADIPEQEISHSRRMSMLRRQLLISLLVEPSLLCNASIRSQISILGAEDQSVNLLAKKLIDNRNSKTGSESSEEIKVIQGLSKLVSASPQDREEILAKFKGILMEAGLSEEGLLEEALKQLSISDMLSDSESLNKAKNKMLQEYSTVVERIKLTDELDMIRHKEAKESDVENRLNLAQEKLLRKRSLSKAAKDKQ